MCCCTMVHVRRGDLWSGTIEILLLAVYWWHPLVWVARGRLQRIREEIADAVVVCEGQRDAGRYAETLLRVAKAAVGRPTLALGLMGILESGGALRRRVEVLLEARRVRHAAGLGWWVGDGGLRHGVSADGRRAAPGGGGAGRGGPNG